MKRLLLITSLLFPVFVTSAAGNDLIYRPEPFSGLSPLGPEAGIVVRTITIKQGDSLSKLSRRYSGKGHYFPQILIFNRIANPDLIYAGDTLRVPVRPATSAGESVAPATPVAQTGQSPVSETASVAPTAQRELYAKAMAQYRKKRYRTALDLFNRFIRDYPDSPQAADATFYRGECYLNLSRQ